MIKVYFNKETLNLKGKCKKNQSQPLYDYGEMTEQLLRVFFFLIQCIKIRAFIYYKRSLPLSYTQAF